MKSMEIFGLVVFSLFGAFLTWGFGLSESGEVGWLGGGLVFAAIYYGAMKLWSAINKQ